MKIATYNCNGIRARINNTVDWLKLEKPDILCVQEIKVVNELFPHEPFNEIGYKCEVRGKKAHAGVAFIYKEKLKADEFHGGFRDGDESEEPRILAGKWGKLNLINTYCPQGRAVDHEQFQYKLNWFKKLRKYFDKHYTTRKNVIWTGDINVAPEPIDVYDSKKVMGHVCHTPEVFEALKGVTEWGFSDLYRHFHPDKKEFSYFDFRVPNTVKNNVGWRIDQFWVSNPVVKNAKKCWIDIKPRTLEKPSDHTFVIAEINL